MTFDQFLKLPLLHPAGPLSAELQRKFDTTIVHNHFYVHALINIPKPGSTSTSAAMVEDGTAMG